MSLPAVAEERATARSEPITVRELPPEAWDGVVESFPEHTIFHGRGWLEAIAVVRKLEVIRLVAEVGGGVVAAWPFLLWRRGPVRIIGSPLPATGTIYLGPLVRPGVDVTAPLRAILAHPSLQHHAYLGARVIDEARAFDLAPFGFARTRDFETYRLDVRRTEQELWDGLRGECRNRIRKASALGLEVEHETSLAFLDDFWNMTRETFHRTHGRPTHNRALVAALWAKLRPRGQLVALSARQRGERVAMLILPCDTRTMYYWAGASFDRHRQLPAGNLLQWEAIREASRRGLERYDLDSTAGPPGRFKRSLGAAAVRTATHWERVPWRAVAAIKRLFEHAAGRPGPTPGQGAARA